MAMIYTFTNLRDVHVTGVTFICSTKAEAAEAVFWSDGNTVEFRRPTQLNRISLDNYDGIRRGEHRPFAIDCLTGVGTLVCGLGIWTNEHPISILTGGKRACALDKGVIHNL